MNWWLAIVAALLIRKNQLMQTIILLWRSLQRVAAEKCEETNYPDEIQRIV